MLTHGQNRINDSINKQKLLKKKYFLFKVHSTDNLRLQDIRSRQKLSV